jgi:hypothetical protein
MRRRPQLLESLERDERSVERASQTARRRKRPPPALLSVVSLVRRTSTRRRSHRVSVADDQAKCERDGPISSFSDERKNR